MRKMLDEVKVQDLERTAFSLFSRDSSDSFKRAVCYLVLSELDRRGGTAVSLSKLQQSVSQQFAVPAEDIRSALAVLKCPTAFKAVHMWSHKQNKDVTLVRYVNTPEIASWVNYIKADFPHIANLVH